MPIPLKGFTAELDAAVLRDWVLGHVQESAEGKEFERMVLARLRMRVVVEKGAKTVKFIP